MSRQFLLMIDENAVAPLLQLFPTIQLIEVQGMDLAENKDVKLLVTPNIAAEIAENVPETPSIEPIES